MNNIIQGDCIEELKKLESNSINMCMTSPPYWALRDYGTNVETIWDEVCLICKKPFTKFKSNSCDCERYTYCEHNFELKEIQAGTQHWNQGGKVIPYEERKIHNEKIMEVGFCKKCQSWKGQLGLEPSFDLYIKHLCDIFDEVKRVLKDDGTCWINIGDTYSSGNRGANIDAGVNLHNADLPPNRMDCGIPDKSLCMIPFRFAIEMVNRGWILRNTIIWYKPSCMPSSVKDRFTVDFEYLFFFSKKKKYYFETQYEPVKKETIERYKYGWEGNTDRGYPSGPQNHMNTHFQNPEAIKNVIELGRNKRTVWTINPQPFGENVCMICGYFDKPKNKQQQKGYFGGEDKSEYVCKMCRNSLITSHFAIYPEELCETPIKAGCPEKGIVLDPFFGAGTTGLVALKQNKKFIGIELNKEYIEIANKRLKPFLEQTKL